MYQNKKNTGHENINAALTTSPGRAGKRANGLPDNRPQSAIQKKQVDTMSAEQKGGAVIQQKTNHTGLPDQLKSGIESISGMAMDDVKVQYNSPKPAQLNAHAYAQGTDIHIAPGQEKHLPHEAWHVVQQKQGRVKPTMQMKRGVPVNDDKGLEKEADMMGAKASMLSVPANPSSGTLQQQPVKFETIVQRFPYERMNEKTKRAFKIIHHGTEIEAIQIGGDPDDIHYASLTYKIANIKGKNVFELSHIISDPETGSGLGGLLVYYMAKIAEGAGFATIEIPMAASTAIGFYEHLGWKSNDTSASNALAQRFFDAPGQNEDTLNLYFNNTARIAYNSDPENHAKKKRGLFGSKEQLKWENLSGSKQQVLIEAERKKFKTLSPGKQLGIVNMLNHNKAVANIGMTGKTAVIIGRSLGSTLNTWVDTPPTWEKVKDSREDKKHLTEFPRHPDE
jgi:hypothetical protein